MCVRTMISDGRVGLGVGGVERGAQVVGRPAVVEPLDVEAVGLVAQPDVLAEREAGRALDRDVVVVVDQAELAQAEEARRCELASPDTPSMTSPSEQMA